MPRKYVRKTEDKVPDPNEVLAAVKAIKIDQKSTLSVAQAHNIPKSNLYRYLKKINEAYPDISKASNQQLLDCIKQCSSHGGKPIFRTAEEESLVKYLLSASKLCFGLSRNELRRMALEFAKKIKIDYPESWNENAMASRDWYEGFMKRHKNLTLRSPEQISANRMKAFNKANVDSFFVHLNELYTDKSFEPHRIWNMDETGLPTVPTKVIKVIAEEGTKRVGQMASQERGTNVTMAIAVNAIGHSIPPFFLFPRKKMQTHFMDNSTPGSVGFANGSGWMKKDEFIKFMNHFIKYSNSSKDSNTLLLLDNHMSHLSVEAIDLAIDHGITLFTFPPHCRHRLQPLDVSIFGPLKKFYASQTNAWAKSNVGRQLDIHHVPSIVEKCLDLAVTPRNIKSGFNATGIFPFNPDIFTEDDFIQAEISGENIGATEMEISTNPDDCRNIVVVFDDESGAEEEVSISEFASTSDMATTSTASLDETLHEIGPIHRVTPIKKSNRGRKPMESAVLTSAEKRKSLETSAQKSAQKKRQIINPIKKTPPSKKRDRQTSSESD